MAKAKEKEKGKQATMAARADRHAYYEASVQDTESELEFVSETFEELTGRKLLSIREDFCGTGNTACAWVASGKKHTALGVDLDREVLDWGRAHHVAALKKGARDRVSLIHGDVLDTATEPVDAVLAMNFSYYLFTTRERLRDYFRAALAALKSDGVLFLDAFGGYEAHQELEERTEYDDFTYVWDQSDFNPIDQHMTCRIHFEFSDGSEWRDAFVYHWRLWTLPEIRELLLEAGAASATVYWEGTDEETGEGDGIYMPSEQGDADAGWIAYIVARPPGCSDVS
ncbi:MAG: class I SAM-dependent methyltransferase [Wenzhouxiangellaceae bacterium]|nr:class I SAM-dependent methyltransferase [Wenzhouxiangellaceae bacterium]MBS3823423.1 class I SAM-dependent methyltransferase [Wenzhouxiangellaceae bacterium]